MDKKLTTNIALDSEKSNIFSNVEGLALQSLFYTNTGKFPNCYMFTRTSKTADNYFDTKKALEMIKEKASDDEKLEIIKYVTYTIDEENRDKDDNEDAENIGFCFVLHKSNIYARIERFIGESYILYDEDEEKIMWIRDILKECYVSPEKENNNIWQIVSSQNGYNLIKSKVKVVEDFDVEKQYNDDFQKEDKKINDFMSEDNKSGLVILHGEKGTGKTTYIRHLINKYNNRKFVFVPSGLINLLSEPSFGSFLMTLRNHVIILEDCENAIRDRKSTNSSAVSLLLNMTDGLLSDDLEMKFICTFNEDVKNIDQALVRKGRLISKYEFKQLSAEKTDKLIDELYNNPAEEEDVLNPIALPHKAMTLADIYNIKDDSYEEKRKSII